MSIQVHVDETTKAEFDTICEGIGLSPSGAINIFIKGVINHRGLPFTPIMIATIEDANENPKKMSRAEMFGCMRGEFTMSEDFDAPLDDFKEYM